jgi:hypothetical protein
MGCVAGDFTDVAELPLLRTRGRSLLHMLGCHCCAYASLVSASVAKR